MHARSSICHCVGALVCRLVSHLCFRRFPGDFRITSPAQSHAFLFFVVQLHVFLLLLFGQRPLMEPKGTKSCRIQGESIRPVRPYIHPSPPPGSSEADPGLSDGWTDGRVDGTYRFPLYSTGLCPLQFPQGPLPCLHNSYHDEIPEQGKGTDDHLLPLGNWFISIPTLFVDLCVRP